MFIGYRTITYYMKKNPQYRNIIIGNTVSQVEVKLRVTPNKAYVLPILNHGLKVLMGRGDVKKNDDKYQ
jgi:hypothetical protein